jgi:hypothetical protein
MGGVSYSRLIGVETMKVIFSKAEAFTGYAEPVDMDSVPRKGDGIVLDSKTDRIDYVLKTEWHPFGNGEHSIPVVYVTLVDLFTYERLAPDSVCKA